MAQPVPLYFLQRNGWTGRVVALGYSFLSNEEHLRFGNCIRQANRYGKAACRIHCERRSQSSA
jgi:aromatic ring-opening dioxygenase LigB subunit